MGRYISRDVGIACIAIGLLELILGICIIITTAVFSTKVDTAVVTPYWSGVPLMMVGVVGMIAGAMKTKGLVVNFLILSVLIAIVMLLSAIFAGLASRVYNCAVDYLKEFGCYTSDDDCICYTSKNLSIGSPQEKFDGVSCSNLKSINILLEVVVSLSVLALLVAIAGIVASAIGSNSQDDDTEILTERRHKNQSRTVVIRQQPDDNTSSSDPAPVHQPSRLPPLHSSGPAAVSD